MKKQKIALGKLALKKERIADLSSEQQGVVLGGNPSLQIVCQASVQVICQQTILCITHIVAQCLVTRVGTHCIPIPVTTTKTITDPGPGPL